MSLDYSLDGGFTWTTAPSGNVLLNTVSNTFVLTVPAGTVANTYNPGLVMVRDTFAQNVTGACGRWVVNTFNPATVGSGTLIFGFEAANPSCVAFDSFGNVNRINDIGGSGRYMTIGPTAIPSPSTFPPPLTVPAGSGVLGGAPVGPLAPYLRLSGKDGTRSLVGLTPPLLADNLWDTNANFFDAGPLGGPNDALIQMWDTSNMQTGTQTCVFAMFLDVTVLTQFGCGPIWGRYPTTSTVSYVSACRWHSGTIAAQYNDQAVSGMFLTNGQAISQSGWYVCSTVKSGTLFEFRVNKGSFVTNTATSTGAFHSTNFYWGGSLSNSLNQSTGNTYPVMGDFYIYSGALNSTDLGNVETMVGDSVGLTI